MLDFVGAQAAAATIMTSGEAPLNADLSFINLPVVAAKNNWKTQITGAYDLIFPYMHKDYALRTETDLAIYSSFKKHHISWKHNGKKSKRMIWANDAIKTMYIPKEIFVAIAGFARMGSPVNAIGYGV
jgi:hypothetical protein